MKLLLWSFKGIGRPLPNLYNVFVPIRRLVNYVIILWIATTCIFCIFSNADLVVFQIILEPCILALLGVHSSLNHCYSSQMYICVVVMF